MAEEYQERPKGLGAKPKPLELGGDERTKWRAWKASFKWYAKTVKLSALSPEEQVAVFMSHLGPAVTDIYEGFALTDAQERDLELVKARFDEHFDAKENHAYESLVFNTMVQEDGEKMVDYISRVRIQLQRCQFVETGEELRKRLLRDRLIAGVRSESLRTDLLMDKELTLTKTIQMCKAFER